METKTPTKKESKTSKAKATPSLEVISYTQTGTKADSITLPKAVFGVKWNADLVHQVVLAMQANKRSGTAHTKDRSEVSGGGKKPWAQKGTGRARHGSSRSPIWVGGGVTFGPRAEKSYAQKINKKMRTSALFSVLSKKLSLGKVLFIDSLSLEAMKTKNAAAVITSLSGIEGFARLSSKKPTTALIALAASDRALEKSFANLPGITVGLAKDLNALDAMTFNHIVLVNPKEVVPTLEAKLK